jgi:curli biogenesis system outer membrane secretion channel CsgG
MQGGGVVGGFTYGVGFITIPFVGNTQKLTATGDVILLEQTTESTNRNRANRANATGIEKAIYTVSDDLIKDLPENSKIAVISISSNNRDVSALVVDELEYHLVSAKKFTIVDRRTLDAIRAEQNFQMSGDVSDASAVSIGQMLGANIVITGSITGAGTNQRLSIRALDVNTAQIVTMVRETF